MEERMNKKKRRLGMKIDIIKQIEEYIKLVRKINDTSE